MGVVSGFVASKSNAPASVATSNESDFERAARDAHAQLGPATAENLDRMLQSFGFREQ